MATDDDDDEQRRRRPNVFVRFWRWLMGPFR